MSRRVLLPLVMIALTLTALLAVSGPAGAAQLEIAGASAPGPAQQWADDGYAPTYPGTSS